MTGTPGATPATSAWGEDTMPQAVVPEASTPEQDRRAARDLASALLVRCLIAYAAALALLVVSVLMFRHGVRDDHFPAFVAGVQYTVITRYSGPWIAGAAGALLLAGLTATSGTVDLVRRFRVLRLERARG